VTHMSRFEATKSLLAQLGDEPVVSSLGRTTFDLYAAEDRAANYYLCGAMGMASSVALGLALARPDTKVFALEGDGALLMNLGSLVTIASAAPPNLVLIVWDNGEYESTGGQATATAAGLSLLSLVRAAGIQHAVEVDSLPAFETAVEGARAGFGTHVVIAKVRGSRAHTGLPRTPAYFTERFIQALSSTSR